MKIFHFHISYSYALKKIFSQNSVSQSEEKVNTCFLLLFFFKFIRISNYFSKVLIVGILNEHLCEDASIFVY